MIEPEEGTDFGDEDARCWVSLLVGLDAEDWEDVSAYG